MQAQPAMAGAVDPQTMMNQFKDYVSMLVDPACKDGDKWKAAQEINKHLEVILNSSWYPSFLEHAIKIFLKILDEGEPLFIAEYNLQQVRKLILEMLYRLPTNETLRPYSSPILLLMMKLLEVDNQENVLVCLKIIIELHKQYKPPFSGSEIQKFLNFVKSVYSNLPKHMNKIFEPRSPIKVKDLTEINIEELLQETFTMTIIQTETRNNDGTLAAYYLIPKAVLSLKVLQELPIIVVLMYQLYKQNVYQDVSDFIPLIMKTITLQPTLEQRQAETFNKEIFVDFMGAQIKTLSFLAYIVKIYQSVVKDHSAMMVQGMLQLLTLCPMEIAHLRRELLIAARHILATDLRNNFVPHMERLFDEDVLLGRGWTTHESLRPLAYSTLADLVHHVRHQLSLADLGRAVHLFSKNVHDGSLATTIQTMSCKVLLNLVDPIRIRSEAENSTEGRELLMRMLEVFVLKFKTIAKIQLPILSKKCEQSKQEDQTSSEADPDSKCSSAEMLEGVLSSNTNKEEKSKFGFPQNNNYNIADYQSLVKALVWGVKTITWGCAACRISSGQPLIQAKHFQPHETLVFVRLVKWALKALDIYTLNAGPLPVTLPQRTSQQKEEKIVLEHFSGVFSMMHSQTFHEIFSTTIEYLVERVYKNPNLQIVPNTLLANPATSPIFATVLVEYLLERMEEMGSNVERSNLYLRLFKLVFGSVPLYPQENENMLRPHLHKIVNRSMELAMSAVDPYNYFLILRALFRSIGGGSHDLLYQEFLPLLPNLLEGLNRLQSGLHKQHMKDLFIELCLTVPVRLSSLLPYLPMLMDPLVSALNGSPVLISQGLRTLELCVDNLQHDFLYEHIQPVRAELMQVLWRTLRNNDQVAQVAFKVLGKFGGGNRKMMIEPQKLDYVSSPYDPPALVVTLHDLSRPIEFPVSKVMETALNALKLSNTDPFYRRQAWEAISSYLTACRSLDDDEGMLINLFLHPQFQDPDSVLEAKASGYRSVDDQARETHKTALVGMFVGAAIKELREPVIPVLVSVVRHYTMVAVAQQSGPLAFTPTPNNQTALDPLVLIDALAIIMGHEERELCKPGHFGMVLILDTATALLGSREKACRLPFIEYLSEKMCSLCYERAWYAKLGGCIAIKFMFERCTIKWVYRHMYNFLKALLFVLMDLTGEVSSGALNMAKDNLQKMLVVGLNPLPADADQSTVDAREEALCKVTHEMVRQVTSPHKLVREQCMASLRLLAEKQNKSISAIMEPFKEVLADMVPPKKHLLVHQPAISQMGLMDGNTFCMTLTPRLFSIDLLKKEHSGFIQDLMSLCSSEDSKLNTFSCYRGLTNFIPLRISALKVLAACHYLEPMRDKIFLVLYKTLEKPNSELQEATFKCLKQFNAGYPVKKELVQQCVKPLLEMLSDPKALTLHQVKMLSYLTQLFPNVFNEKLERLLEILQTFMDDLSQVYRTNQEVNGTALLRKDAEEEKIVTMISIFDQIPDASPSYIGQLCQMVFQTELAMKIEASSQFRTVLMQFLLRYPAETLDMFLNDNYIKEKQYSRYLEFLIKHKDGKPFRDFIQNNMVKRLITMVLSNYVSLNLEPNERYELQYRSIRIISLLIKYDDQWLSTQQELVNALRRIWCDDAYQERHKNVRELEYSHWKEPKLLVKILLHYFCHHPNDIDLLFQLLRATVDRFIPEFQFLRDFLENTVAQNYTIEWKRSAFFRFVDLFPTSEMSQELKTKVLQMILIPCFAVSFERGETNKLVGGPPIPYQDNNDNVVSAFINKLIDPDNPFPSADCVRISLLQFSCLLVEQASPHIHDHDANNKAQLRRLMMFAWPCLLVENCIDPATRYHGHLLLSHIIDKFAIHRKIVLQVFHSLLKAHAVEARSVVRQALEILTPSMPLRMEEGHTMLTHWTKKIIVDEGHSMQQLFHILQLVVKHYKVYYPVRHHLVQHMVNSIQRLGFSPTATLEHRKLAVELAEVIIKWEIYGIKEELENPETAEIGEKRPFFDDLGESSKKKMAIPGPSGLPVPQIKTEPGLKLTDKSKPIDRAHTDTVLNFLLRLACQVNEQTPANPANPVMPNPGEILSKRCVILLKTALKPELWTHPVDLKLGFFDKIFSSIETPNANVANICTALDLLTYLLGVLNKEQILASFKPLQKSIRCCITCGINKVNKLVHNMLTRLMSIFPMERNAAGVYSKHEELGDLYSTIGNEIIKGLNNYNDYQKKPNTSPNTSALYTTVMLLKGACTNNRSYIDQLMMPFTTVLIILTEEHLKVSTKEQNAMTSELLIMCLELVKTRVFVMNTATRTKFISSILVDLIEGTKDIKVMKAICKMLEDWLKCKNEPDEMEAPSLSEKKTLLVKMMQCVEKKFPDDKELNAQFLELVIYIYTDKNLKGSQLTSKMEPAFLAGLSCNQHHIREKFFKIFDETMRRTMHDRLLYIVCSQNWDAIGEHYWIKQCIELLIVNSSSDNGIKMSHESSILPSITSVIYNADKKKREEFDLFQFQNPQLFENVVYKEEPSVDQMHVDTKPDVTELNRDVRKSFDFTHFGLRSNSSEQLFSNMDEGNASLKEKPVGREETVKMLRKHFEFIRASRSMKTGRFLDAAAQLCHMDKLLAQRVWLSVFPQLWAAMGELQRNTSENEIVAFISSQIHGDRRDYPSALHTFVEAVCKCDPPIRMHLGVMELIAHYQTLYHRMALTMENMISDASLRPVPDMEYEEEENEFDAVDFEEVQIRDYLGSLYSRLCEEDLWAGLWQKQAHYKETNLAIAYEQHGFFEQAQLAYEAAMARHKADNIMGTVPPIRRKEVSEWNEHWIRCGKQLNQWDFLMEYARNTFLNEDLTLEGAWRVPNWDLMKKSMCLVEHVGMTDEAWKKTMYAGYLQICHPEDSKVLKSVDKHVESATVFCLRKWRRLPHIVSHIHLPLLQAAQQIMELQEAYQIHKGLTQQGHQNSLHDMKAIVKTWRNRLPVIADDLSHWNDIFTWRQHHYQVIVKHYEKNGDTTTANSMLGVHALAQSIINFGKMARKHKLTNLCLETLNRIYSIPSVPVVDCFQKVKQQIKCYLQMASMSDKSELNEGLEVVKHTKMQFFQKEMTAEFYALQGMMYHLTNKSDEANKAFSAAVQMHDTSIKAWALYGDYLEQVFMGNRQQISFGVNAMSCFLHACRQQNETKARKYLAKVLWLLNFDDENSSLMEALDKYSVGIPPTLWLPWTPQLLNCLMQYDGNVILNLLCLVGRVYPQAVYFPIRTLCLTLRTAAARKTNSAQQQPQEGQVSDSSQNISQNSQPNSVENGTTPTNTASETSSIKATPEMMRCLKIMKTQRDIHMTIVSSLEGIADQMEWFKENWYELVLRQLRQGLTKCYAIAFENKDAVNSAEITPHLLNFIQKLMSTFGIGVENISSSTTGAFNSAASESLARRAEVTYRDPVFKAMKVEFTKEFDFSQPNSLKLHTVIYKLKKWIKILDNRSKMHLQSFLIEEKCRFLSNFTLKTAEVELPGEFLLPKHNHYFVKISRFMPRVDVVQKHNCSARRLYIRGHNGKIYPYLVINDSGLADARREERVLQLMRMLNLYLGKQKETARRFLNYTVPRVVAVSQQIRLVEDNPASSSLLDVFKKRCAKLGIEHDDPIQYYYERLANAQSRGLTTDHQLTRDIFKEIQQKMVPKQLLKQWATDTFPSATDYWQFRKMFTLQLSLACFAEYVFHLTRLNPDMMYLHQDSGLMNISYFKFDVDDSTGAVRHASRPVPFRLTPCIAEYLMDIGVCGPMTACMIALARCLVYPHFKVLSIVKPILRDEMMLARAKMSEDITGANQEKLSDSEQIIVMVNNAVTAISNRLNSVAYFDGTESKVATLAGIASNSDNLSQMDPAWHPWL